MPENWDVVVIGGGPSGLRAAEMTSAAGWRTVVADAMPSVGRKFLVAGRGGLNLTHAEPIQAFTSRYGRDLKRWNSLLQLFSPEATRSWARDLGIETFIGTSGRIFPEKKQAAPLLRRWVDRLRAQGVAFRLRHRMIRYQACDSSYEVTFSSSLGEVNLHTRALLLACGGASWPQTGSDGAWVPLLQEQGVKLSPLTPANCGYEVAWPASLLLQAEGLPLKNIRVRAGAQEVMGELLLTRYGLEGGALYQLGAALRAMATPEIFLDLKPTFSSTALAEKIVSSPSLEQTASAWRLSPAAQALLAWQAVPNSALSLAQTAKALRIPLLRPRPLAEAISTSGGILWEELDEQLMFHRQPGLFAAGEMVDWDAPTGGYLLQGCLATGTCAGLGAAAWLKAG